MRKFPLFLLLSVPLAVFADSADLEWAEEMLRVRTEFQANGLSKQKLDNSVRNPLPSSVTARVFRDTLAKWPYRTDWFLQDNGNNLEAWLKQKSDPAVEQKMAENLSGLSSPTGDTNNPDWLADYAEFCAARREQRLAGIKKAFPKIVFTKNHTLMPSFFAYTEGQSDAQDERQYIPETSLCVMEWDGAFAKVSELINDPLGRIRDPEVSFDGSKVLFSWKKSDRLDDYHLYEMDVASCEIRQLTFGLGVADFEPRYMPNGDIVFSSSRCIQTIDCWKTETSNLYTCGPNGENLRRLGFDQVHTVHPALLSDGRVVYTRWDYNDRGQIYPQGLFQMNPDGSGQTEYYGNNSWFPTTIAHAREIPGSTKLLAVAMGHHTWQAGELMLLDISKGRQEESGVQLIAPVRETKPIKQDKYGQEGDLAQYPYPMNENEFLVAYCPLGGKPEARFGIYYMDQAGNRELLVSDPTISCQHPIPLIPREKPVVRPSQIDYSQDFGEYYIQDVYFGPGLKGVERGSIKKIRVVELEFRAAQIGFNKSKGPGGGARVSTPISIGNGSWDVKRILGDADVQSDGSAYFKVPARTPVYFQCLDENNRAVQTMRSWSTLQPGELFSCIGCHEDKNATPLQRPQSLALSKGVQTLAPFYGETRGFSFAKEIQPILDAKCVTCHKQKKAMDLSGTVVLDKPAKRNWSRSYLNLTQAAATARSQGTFQGRDADGLCVWVSSQSVPSMIPPRSVGSTVSPLIDKLLKGHGKLTRAELDRFIAWIDLAVPFCGDYEESNAWSDKESAIYDRYSTKRAVFAAQDDKNVEMLLAGDFSAPVATDLYRNLAPLAKLSASSECRGMAPFLAKNVVDGDKRNTGHGKNFPSWGPELEPKSWLRFDWDHDVFVDRLNIYIRADFKKEHDSWWKSGVVELSTGEKIPFELEKTSDLQVISLPIKQWPPKPIRWLKIDDLTPNENKWCGFSEVEVMGLTDLPKYNGSF